MVASGVIIQTQSSCRFCRRSLLGRSVRFRTKGNGVVGENRAYMRPMRSGVKDWRIGAGNPDDREPAGFNPFDKKTKGDEDAAKKAIQDMFSGQKDVLAAFDDQGGDGGDNSDDGGGGGWNWSWEDWKNGFGDFGRRFMSLMGSVGKTIAAVLLFGVVVVGLSLIGPAWRWLVGFFKTFMRLEKTSPVHANPSAPAGTQRSVLFPDDEEQADE